jgi:NADH-quinone oxidoreductase subunit I
MIRIKAPKPDLIGNIKLHIDALLTGVKEAVLPSTMTIHYPRERRKLPDNFRGYILFVPENCISCFQCSFVCPANAITMKKADNERNYPTIDYAKCIFCHFCVDTCPGNALQPTKIHDVAYKDMEEMLTQTEEMVKSPEIQREDTITVEYVIEDVDLLFRRIAEKDELVVKTPPHEKVREISSCIEPESCLACAICVGVCPNEAISIESSDVEKVIKIDSNNCTGCGLCVKECPVQILRLTRVSEDESEGE